jgi:hypothetical protein
MIGYIVLELFEVQWQKADTIISMLQRIHKRYSQNILLFFILHPTFIFGIWLMMVTNASAASMILLFIKAVDIATKIVLIQQVFEKKDVPPELENMLSVPLNPAMPYIGLLVYPPLVYMALMF